MRRFGLTGVAVLVVLLASPGAWAEFGPVQFLTPSDRSSVASLDAVFADGSALLALETAGRSAPYTQELRLATRRRGEPFEVSRQLDAGLHIRLGQGPAPSGLASMPTGLAVVTWTSGHRVRAVVRHPDGSVEEPQEIGHGLFPRALVNARGDAAVVWTVNGGGFEVAVRPLGASSFGAARQLSSFSGSVLASATSGRAIVVAWIACVPEPRTCRPIVQAAVAKDGRHFEKPQTLGPLSARVPALHLTTLPTGAVLADWSALQRGPVRTALLPAGASRFKPTRVVSRPRTTAGRARIAVGRRGGLLAWIESKAGKRLVGAEVGPGGRIGAPFNLSSKGHNVAGGGVRVNDQGAAVAWWFEQRRWWIRSRRAGGTFTPAVELPSPSESVVLIGAGGRITALFAVDRPSQDGTCSGDLRQLVWAAGTSPGASTLFDACVFWPPVVGSDVGSKVAAWTVESPGSAALRVATQGADGAFGTPRSIAAMAPTGFHLTLGGGTALFTGTVGVEASRVVALTDDDVG